MGIKLCVGSDLKNTTFCDPKLPEVLGVPAMPHNYTLTKLFGYKNVVAGGLVEGLKVHGVVEEAWHALPPRSPMMAYQTLLPKLLHLPLYRNTLTWRTWGIFSPS